MLILPNREPHRKPRPPGAWPQTACPPPHPLGWARPQPQAQTGDTVEEALLPGSHLIPPVTARGRSATPPSGTQDTARSRGGRLSPALAIAPVGIGPLPSVSLQLPQPQTPPGPAPSGWGDAGPLVPQRGAARRPARGARTQTFSGKRADSKKHGFR